MWFCWEKGSFGDWQGRVHYVTKPKEVPVYNSDSPMRRGIIEIPKELRPEDGSPWDWDEIKRRSPKPETSLKGQPSD